MTTRKDRRGGTRAAVRLGRREAGDPYATVTPAEPAVRRWVIGIIVALLAVSGWAMVTGGVLDSPVAHTVRSVFDLVGPGGRTGRHRRATGGRRPSTGDRRTRGGRFLGRPRRLP